MSASAPMLAVTTYRSGLLRRLSVLRMIMASAMKMALVGLTFGSCVSLLLTHSISSAMLGVIRIEPPVFVLLTTLLAFVAAVAAYIPCTPCAAIKMFAEETRSRLKK
jgi:hypothetical protein